MSSTFDKRAIGLAVPTLTTSRLALRAFRTADYADYVANMNDPEATKYTTRPVDRNMWWSFAAASGGWILDGAGWWAVEHRELARAIGMVGVFIRESAPDDHEIGWVIYRPFWRQGFAVEASKAALEFAFEGHRASSVLAHIESGNVASIAVAKKLGLTYENEVELYGKPVGRYRIIAP